MDLKLKIQGKICSGEKIKTKIVYCAAAVGINMNVNTLKQKYMGVGEKSSTNGHTDDIMSLGICP